MLALTKRLAKWLPPFRRILRERDEYARECLQLAGQRDEAVRQRDEAAGRCAELTRRLDALVAKNALDCYEGDGMRLADRTTDFLRDPRFSAAYRAGIDSGHGFGDIRIEWRMLVLLWAASHALRLEGDFVECGVNTGIFSPAICNYIDFNRTGRRFFLFDTFAGIPEEQMSPTERVGRIDYNERYPDCYETAQRNFALFPNARLIRGRVPESLAGADIGNVCYLCLDMNIAHPERAALEHFWPKLSAGAPVVLDDYGFTRHAEQKRAIDDFARANEVPVAQLASGQGLMIKPP